MSYEATVAIWAVVAAGCLVLSALFTLGEARLFREGKQRIERRVAPTEAKATSTLTAIRELRLELAVAQVGALLGAIGMGVGLGRASAALTGAWPAAPTVRLATQLAAWVLVVLLYVALGHTLPRALDLERGPAAVQRAAVGLVRAAAPVLAPLVHWSEALTSRLLRLERLELADRLKEEYPAEELGAILLRSHRYGLLGAAERELVRSVFQFKEPTAKQIATPRSDMACIPASMRVGEALEAVRHIGFTRYPVCEGSIDRVIGIVHFRDLIDGADANPRQPVTDVMQPAVYVPENMSASEVLKTLQQAGVHMAIVEEGRDGVMGLVTLEDVLAAFFAERPAAAHDRPAPIKPVARDVFEIDGELIVEEVEDALGVDLRHAGLQTIGGYVFGRLGRKAREGDSLKVNGVLFDVLEMRGARITKLRAQRTREIPRERAKANH